MAKDPDQMNIRIPPEYQERLQEIAKIESKKTGYPIKRSGLIRKILIDFCESYKK